MSYQRLPFGDYYIITSQKYHKVDRPDLPKIEYNHVKYTEKLLGFIPIKVSAEWECHYDEGRDVIQVNFEATTGVADWIVNMLFTTKVYDEFMWEGNQIQLKACKGWMKMWFMMKHQVREAIANLLKEHPDAEVEIVGWSLGSSQAQYCAQDLNFNTGIEPHLFTDGSVKPWRKPFSKKKAAILKSYLDSCTKETYNFMHRSDIVCYMPPFSRYFAMNPVKLGKFKFFGLFKPRTYHTSYGEAQLYEGIK